MKRICAMMLAVLLIFSLCSCHLTQSPNQESVSFYYERSGSNYVYGQEDSVIVSESREISGNRNNLRYILTLYFHGPLDSSLSSPFPEGTSLVESFTEDDVLEIKLNSVFAQLEGIDLTIACTCLAMTCFDLIDANAVRILASPEDDGAAVSITITRDNVLLKDSIPETTAASE